MASLSLSLYSLLLIPFMVLSFFSHSGLHAFHVSYFAVLINGDTLVILLQKKVKQPKKEDFIFINEYFNDVVCLTFRLSLCAMILVVIY